MASHLCWKTVCAYTTVYQSPCIYVHDIIMCCKLVTLWSKPLGNKLWQTQCSEICRSYLNHNVVIYIVNKLVYRSFSACCNRVTGTVSRPGDHADVNFACLTSYYCYHRARSVVYYNIIVVKLLLCYNKTECMIIHRLDLYR